MGGVLSGSRNYRGGKKSIDSLPVANITADVLFSLDKHQVTVIPVCADLAEICHFDRSWMVIIDFTPLNFGGKRRWMLCPKCHYRRQSLFILGGELACRTCLQLRYECQHENKRSRMFRHADKIRRKLGWPLGIGNANGVKPKGMHKKTYNKLCVELHSVTKALIFNINDWIERMNKKHCSQVN